MGPATQDLSPEAVAVAESRRKPVSGLGPEYEKQVVPAMPCVDVIIQPGASLEGTLPALFHTPLFKQADGPIPGFASGTRSGLIRTSEGVWVRLKGCGNNYEGFPSRPFSEEKKDLITVRGCSFEHCAHRELFISHVLEGAMKGEGFIVANESLGWFEYAVPQDPYPKIKKCCSLFKAHGEKRLGDHLLVGVELMMLDMISEEVAEQVAQLFPADRKESGSSSVSPTWMQYFCEPPAFVDAVNWKIKLQEVSLLAPSSLSAWSDVWSAAASTLNRYIQQQQQQDQKKAKEETEGEEGKSTLSNDANLLAYTVWRLGRDAGAILRLIHAANLSWGTYQDAIGGHCNAHANNFVILPPSEQKATGHLLAPLDFDMAFDRDSFLALHQPKAQTQPGAATAAAASSASSSLWRETLLTELANCRGSLAGDGMCNTGVTAVAETPAKYEPMKWALRDTLAMAFEDSFAGVSDRHPPAAAPAATTSTTVTTPAATAATSEATSATPSTTPPATPSTTLPAPAVSIEEAMTALIQLALIRTADHKA